MRHFYSTTMWINLQLLIFRAHLWIQCLKCTPRFIESLWEFARVNFVYNENNSCCFFFHDHRRSYLSIIDRTWLCVDRCAAWCLQSVYKKDHQQWSTTEISFIDRYWKPTTNSFYFAFQLLRSHVKLSRALENLVHYRILLRSSCQKYFECFLGEFACCFRRQKPKRGWNV